MATRYLQLDWKSSNLFEYSKTEKDGFEKHESSEGNTSYRKYEKKGITGKLLNAGVRDSKIGQQLGLAFKEDDGNIVVIQFGLFDQKGQVSNNYPESIIAHLGNLKSGETYTIYPYNLDADTQRKYDQETEGREERAKYYDRRAVSFKQNGEKVSTYLSYKEGDKLSIPRLDWKEDRFNKGKKKPTATSIEEKNNFLLAELERAVDGHLAYEANNDTNSNTPQPKKEEVIQEPVETSDLPF